LHENGLNGFCGKEATILGKSFNLWPHLSSYMSSENFTSCVKVKSKGFDPRGDTQAFVSHMLQGSSSPTVDDTDG